MRLIRNCKSRTHAKKNNNERFNDIVENKRMNKTKITHNRRAKKMLNIRRQLCMYTQFCLTFNHILY